VPVRNLSSATEAGAADRAQTAGEQDRARWGDRIPASPDPDVDGARDPSQAVVGSEVSSGDTLVPMMESAEVRNRHDPLLGRGLEGAGVRAVLVQRLMGARGIVVGQVGPQQPVEVPRVQDQEVVEALSPDRSAHARRSGTGRRGRSPSDPMTRSTKGFSKAVDCRRSS
jgi:hypothetical protein